MKRIVRDRGRKDYRKSIQGGAGFFTFAENDDGEK
jgi:hypothetical protein